MAQAVRIARATSACVCPLCCVSTYVEVDRELSASGREEGCGAGDVVHECGGHAAVHDALVAAE